MREEFATLMLHCTRSSYAFCYRHCQQLSCKLCGTHSVKASSTVQLLEKAGGLLSPQPSDIYDGHFATFLEMEMQLTSLGKTTLYQISICLRTLLGASSLVVDTCSRVLQIKRATTGWFTVTLQH